MMTHIARKRGRRPAIVAATVIGLGSLAACGSSTGSSSAGAGSNSGSGSGSTSSGSGSSQSAASGSSTALDCNGCGDGKTIKVLLLNWGSGPLAADQTKWEHSVAATFKQDTGANVSFSTYLSNPGELKAIETESVSHSGPDVFQVGSSLIGTAQSAGVLPKAPTATDFALMGGKGKFLPSAIANNLTDNVAVPQFQTPGLFAYNTQLFHEAGISSPPKTWAEYVSDGQKITAMGKSKGVYGTGFDPNDPGDVWGLIYNFAYDMGGAYVNPQGTKAILTQGSTVLDAVKFWFDFYTKWHIAPPASINWTQTQELSAFLQGKIAMMPAIDAGVISSSAGTPLAGHLAYAEIPTVPYGAKAVTPGAANRGGVGNGAAGELVNGYTWNLGVSAWSKEPSLAYRFINVATDDSSELQLVKYFGFVPGTVSATTEAEKLPQIGQFIKLVAEAGAAKGTVGSPPFQDWGTVESAMLQVGTTLSRDVQNGSYSDSAIESALATADQQIDAASAKSGS